jgi:hypothetical protein
MFKFVPVLLLAAFFLLENGANAQDLPDTNLWRVAEALPQNRSADEFWIRPSVFRTYRVNQAAFDKALAVAPRETGAGPAASEATISLPMPDGRVARFRFVESPVMAPELAAKFPQIKTYLGKGVDDPLASVRFDSTPAGIHAQILSPNGAVYVDPYLRADANLHVSFYKRDYQRSSDFQCFTISADLGGAGTLGPQLASSGSVRTYRLACAATGEYTQFQGGTVAAGLAGIVTAINRVTGVYESELAIRLMLVANNDRIVYINGNTDPYNNNSGSTMLSQNQANLDNVIGSANYDIGHVFSTGGGGIAGLGVVCVSGRKANGVTGSSDPTGDAFYIDYVAHEMGHQFGADHTFNSSSGSCGGGTRNASTAYEPGSGSTIMSYAGLCGADDLQPHSDPYFHSASIDQILNYITSGTGGICAVITSIGNNAPSINAGANFAIPKGTPFQLTASGTDPDGETLTFCWEELDLGPSITLSSPDNGASPLFRTFNPTLTPSRTFPQLSDLLNHTISLGETLPTTGRLLRFRVVARDNRPGGGGINSADMQITVSSNAGPFVLTAPNTSVTWSGVQTVTWNVAGTAGSPVNSSNVNILLSTNGGISFPIVLATNVPNDGSHPIVLPNLSTSAARIRVEGAGNIFFDISDNNFSIIPAVPAPMVSLENALLATENCFPGNGAIDPGETVTLNLALRNIGTADTTNLVVTLLSAGGVDLPSAPQSYGALLAGGTSFSQPFSFTATGACGGTIFATLQLQDGTNILGTLTNAFGLGSFASATNSFATTVLASVPGNGTKGVASPYPSLIPVSGLTGIVSRVTVTLTGLTHASADDLDFLLVGPTGQAVLLMSDAGGAGAVSNVNLTFDDAATQSLPFSATIVSGVYKPTNFDTTSDDFPAPAPQGSFGQVLALFNGLDPNGPWWLYILDDSSPGVGSLASWSLNIVTLSPICCTPVNHAPVLAPISDATLFEGNTLIFTNLATDSDRPAQSLSFSLINPPTGAAVGADTGIFDWTPTEAQGPGIYSIVLQAADNGVPPLSATQTFTVTVLESNLPPALAPIPDQVIHAGITLVLSNRVYDPDIPANALGFSLGPGAPAAAAIDPGTGIFLWATGDADSGTTNQITIRVSDDGLPILTDEKSFTVAVVPRPLIQSIWLSNEVVNIEWSAIAGRRYRLQFTEDLASTNWMDAIPDILADASVAGASEASTLANQRFYRVICIP